MEKYFCKVRAHLAQFKNYEIKKIAKSENSDTYAFANKSASNYEADLARSVLVEILDTLSILEQNIMTLKLRSRWTRS